MSPTEADDLFSHLNLETVLNYCGKGKQPPVDPNSLLAYPFGYFTFEKNGTVLMEILLHPEDKSSLVVWVNAHRDSTSKDKNVRANLQNWVMLAKLQAILDGINVHEYEGRQALKILYDTPCLANLRTRH